MRSTRSPSAMVRIAPILLIASFGLITCFVVACVGGPGDLGTASDDVCGYTGYRGYGGGYGYTGYDENGNPCR